MIEETPDEPVAAIAENVAEPPEISFRNPLAVRIGLFLAGLTFLVMILLGRLLPVPGLLPIWLVGVGFLAVYLYRRRTGHSVSPRSGARLGWIIGVFLFVIGMILISLFAVALTDPSFVETLTQMKQLGTDAAATKKAIDELRTPTGLIGILMTVFIFCASLPMVGGMLGATILRRAS